ncbi:MAG TPA: PepSY-associated TM helix domain-containing protein, partial [Tepidisphaeraceae bacterium]|nr:PepSY-associated TM helix domain-containing protein [Tepidisphaeraceae bacterium]
MTLTEPILAPPNRVSRPRPAPAPASRPFYRVVWRWHFYAGLIVAPVLLVASLTGAALVFENDLKPRLWPARYVAQSGDIARRPLSALAATARAHAGDGAGPLIRISTGGFWARPTMLFTFAAGPIVAVDPYAGQVQATFDRDGDVFRTLLALHRNLLAGDAGRVVVELATAWGVVLVVTGVYLWWPRGGSGGRGSWRGVWVPRVRGAVYAVWRDWHAVPAAYASVVLIVVLATGFVFSFTGGALLHWQMDRTGGNPRVFTDPLPSTPAPDAPPTAGLDGVDRALDLYWRPNWRLSVTVPKGPTQSYALFTDYRDRGPVAFDGVTIDRYTGTHLDHFSSDAAQIGYDLKRWGYALHTGAIFGRPTKALALLACLVLAAATVSGAAMWWLRRPQGRLGLPKRPTDARVPRGV